MRLYHNPRCSKSREAFALLTDRGVEFEDYRYLKLGVASEDFEVLLRLENLIRIGDVDKGSKYDLNNKNDLRALLEIDSKLLQRPILIHNGKAVIGRPPTEILTLLHEV
tara:strand:+ start:331 stop:657 length:327 start_codon:yes stop_codon:yes gene_type:complete